MNDQSKSKCEKQPKGIAVPVSLRLSDAEIQTVLEALRIARCANSLEEPPTTENSLAFDLLATKISNETHTRKARARAYRRNVRAEAAQLGRQAQALYAVASNNR